jgi:general secretion pathway protein B
MQIHQIPVQINNGSTGMKEVELPSATVPLAEHQKIEPLLNAAPLAAPASSELTFTLSGIAWNKDSAERLAIINGQPTATGSSVNGVIVEEILQDRVKLSHSGRSFELLIGKPAKMN